MPRRTERQKLRAIRRRAARTNRRPINGRIETRPQCLT